MKKMQEIVDKAAAEAGGIQMLADKLGVDFTTVWRWATGKTVPSRMALRLMKMNEIIH